jgi:hypothetical protein
MLLIPHLKVWRGRPIPVAWWGHAGEAELEPLHPESSFLVQPDHFTLIFKFVFTRTEVVSLILLVMDAVGTIIGVISLGAALCDGIATYCHAWKHQDDDIRSLKALCGTLKQLLQYIEQRLKVDPILEPDIAEKLHNALQECNKHIEAALRLTKKYEIGSDTRRWKTKGKELVKRLKFPFDKNTLEGLRDIMVAFRGNVDTALAILQL